MLTTALDPLAPRQVDLPTPVPLDAPLDVLDGAKILAAPDDPAEWPAWRDALARSPHRDRLPRAVVRGGASASELDSSTSKLTRRR